MKLRIDSEASALYLRLTDAAIVESEEVYPGVVLDFDEDEHVVAVELFGLSDELTSASPQPLPSETD